MASLAFTIGGTVERKSASRAILSSGVSVHQSNVWGGAAAARANSLEGGSAAGALWTTAEGGSLTRTCLDEAGGAGEGHRRKGNAAVGTLRGDVKCRQLRRPVTRGGTGTAV
ncbi:hypothetical protein FISHEDRAFT_61228 [Fistulina hepatica ATCC 64428]|uniref:Uncharacterized protein n=1 Tax=Fistulina hepatica ATCC 64428 TaxID=1128425 RepID=A0A0D7A3F9_9AGAR|nr:hypothetical protein FISHEDRAFT_61228 [Fistulina hepatica ATCC 64428]